MVEIKALNYEEARAEHFKALKDKTECKMIYWTARADLSRPNNLNDPAHIKASEYGADYSYYNDALNALENQPKWISVEERLPEENTSVIAAFEDGHVFQALYAYDGWDLWEGCTGKITHWMPLPEPPEEDGAM